MSEQDPTPTRRNVLKATGAAVATTGTAGLASAAPGEVVEVNVGFADDAGRSRAMDAASEVVREFDFDAATIEAPKRAIDRIDGAPGIRYVEENGEMEAIAQSTPWGVDRVDAEVAHANDADGDGATETGAGADVAIIDTGIDADHPDLQANLGAGKAFVDCGTGGFFGCLFTGNSNSCTVAWDDDNDHGSHVAGTADADDNTEDVVGVSTEATLHAVKVLDCAGSGSFSDIAAGIEYVANQGWDVANMSLGGSSSSTVKDACEYAAGKGVLLVAAAGNDGPCSDCVSYPAAYDEVVAVSATSKDDSLADFSSTGPEIEIAAPGDNIPSTVPGGTDTFSGTSMASPHVAGVGGLLMANGYSATEARDQLGLTAEDLGLADDEQGAGLVDAAGALGLDSSDDLS